ncbi:MAG: alpha/beta hydrolase [Betaproteobacteria bacterium]
MATPRKPPGIFPRLVRDYSQQRPGRRRLASHALGGLVVLVLAACAGGDPRHRLGEAAAAADMTVAEIPAGGFAITTARRVRAPGAAVRVYVEGDGYAWRDRNTPSADPTPRRATGLALAIADPGPNVIYLARPCQYSLDRSPACEAALWTDRRFSEEVIASLDGVLDRLLAASPGLPLELVGYSGGGAVAALLAARRAGVSSLRTVAGNLDHVLLNRLHGVSPMPGSLNAADVAQALATLPQIHYVGAHDPIVAPDIAESFAGRMADRNCVRVERVAGTTHEQGWEAAWPVLLRTVPTCGSGPVTAPAPAR